MLNNQDIDANSFKELESLDQLSPLENTNNERQITMNKIYF
jgi:hypothetical protein